jgi:hypothetical protein
MALSKPSKIVLGAVTAWALFSSPALAQPQCATLPNPVVVAGSNIVRPLISVLSTALAGNITVIAQSVSSCGVTTTIMNNNSAVSTGQYYDVSGTAQSCNFAPGDMIDIAVSDVFPTTCTGITALGAGFGDFLGPVNVMSFIAPSNATAAVAISAKATYLVLGQPIGAKKIAPWTDDSKILIRNAFYSPQLIVAKAIHLEANVWKGYDPGSPLGILAGIQVAASDPMPEKTIGLVSGDILDASLTYLKVLAYQDFGQSCAFLPDRDASRFDKANVRDGQYPLWGFEHFITKVDAAGAPLKPSVKQVIDYLTLAQSGVTSPTQVLAAEIQMHFIPRCAMHVTRSSESAPLSSYAPPQPCNCYFETTVSGSAPASCTPCTTNGNCAAPNPVCRYGYCEAR